MARRVKYDWFYDQDNTIYGDDAAVNWELRGYGGNDVLLGNSGSDLLLGGAGNDRLWGGSGDDILRGGEGNDRLFIDRGNNTYDGGSGIDYVDFSNVITYASGGWWTHKIEDFTVGFSVDLRSGETRSQVMTANGPSAAYSDVWGTNSFENIQTLIMTDKNDVVRDNNAGHTHVLGNGDDLIEGRGGADIIYGDGGTDTASYESSAIGVSVSLATGNGYNGDAAGDVLWQIENLRGSAKTDQLTGDANGNRIEGGAGGDTIRGGGGADVLVGGGDRDFFVFQQLSDSTVSSLGRDTITDFVRGTDFIMLNDLDANSATAANDVFTFIGTTGFSGAARELRVSLLEDSNGALFNRVEGDVNGDARADFAISVYAAGATLGAGDFFL